MDGGGGRRLRCRSGPAACDELIEAALALPVRGVEGAGVLRSAWRLACDLDLPVLYDAAYLAVAETTGATLWTLDRRLVDAVKHRLGYVRLVGAS